MNEKQPITEDLLGKFLAQETDVYESALVENWVKARAENQKELDDYQFIWQQIPNLKEEKIVDVDAAWNKVKTKMSLAKEAKIIELTPKKRSFFTPVRIAASIFFFLLIGLLVLLFNQKNTEILTLKTHNNTLEKTLPDGSVVFLNANTTLNYPTDFQRDTREITLLGEAFFNVQRNESQPFVIHANGSDVKVLGTSFNVKAYSKNVKVSVASGKVAFKHQSKQTLLEKGEEAEFEADKDTIRKALMIDKNVFAYKTKTFVFENSSLEHIIRILSESYHAKIILRNSHIKTCRLTTTFTNESLPNTLNIIAETLNLNINQQGEKYIIDGTGCGE